MYDTGKTYLFYCFLQEFNAFLNIFWNSLTLLVQENMIFSTPGLAFSSAVFTLNVLQDCPLLAKSDILYEPSHSETYSEHICFRIAHKIRNNKDIKVTDREEHNGVIVHGHRVIKFGGSSFIVLHCCLNVWRHTLLTPE